MKIFSVVLFILMSPSILFSDTITVPDDYSSIQEAIDVAMNGDTVLVKPGTYLENIDFKGKAITVKSDQGASVTVVDGNGHNASVVTCNSGEGPDSVLDGFTVTNSIHTDDGGGMYNVSSSPTVTHCIFTKNWVDNYYRSGGGMCNIDSHPIVTHCDFITNYAGTGGGMYNENSSPSVMDCLFDNNQASYSCGGMYNKNNSNPTVENCTFSHNKATSQGGGGMYNKNSSPVVTHCSFSDNSTEYGDGGGMCGSASNPTVTACTFSRNSARNGGGMFNAGDAIVTDCCFSANSAGGESYSSGGGIYNAGGSPLVVNCTFEGNSVFSQGGGSGMYNYYCSAMVSHCTFTGNSGNCAGGMWNDDGNPMVSNCIFTGNFCDKFGGGMVISGDGSSATVSNCTFCGNSTNGEWFGGGGVCLLSCFTADITITNSILWNNAAPEGPEIWIGHATKPSTLTISHSDVKGGLSTVFVDTGSHINWGDGMIDADPLFVDEAGDDCHLTYLSHCRDAGSNTSVTDPFDFEGDPRIYQGSVDMGADEFYTHLYVTGNTTPGGAIQGKFIGMPGATPMGLFVGTGILPMPAHTMWGKFWLQAPWVLIAPLGAIPADGVMVLTTTLPGSTPAPYDIPMQALIGLNPDSLSNLYVLQVR
ncbi:MAG: right-handed parallel beta-helix repeat-containing protein, partial [Planctomycetota bacterium]